MSFIDILVENLPGDYIEIDGHAGLFNGDFKKEENIRILRVYQVIRKNGIKSVKRYTYDNKTGRIHIETHLSYFGKVKFLIKCVKK